ncbi:TetR/AcrR family transcriptional regulator [Paenibacillus alvei]|uniref:TetR family transcriptional regulator n=1 Tax=Paenibacillus alvei TaxID=44250 RepID=A0AAP7A227_PAEAL|nr:TetR family transcriptional regulator [Paenibacillus alvei]MBG9734420.1 TetR family transcriptional regulator [Paenibacillus alvei]MBG9744277.1 TetR family transcriptional regulator [Paenibacillus alvei]MCY9578041.1 TetR/AcrR family transcriptional regulator [Paenibacillus alvei]MCY9585335.1 TetR/AcrR family transcriptional regulator [Paenibacillus alvei]NOJ71956.1 TetR family transcriptional regulator [Paenibacillus alvei]
MTQSKTDPRILRTRKLIMDSFIELSGKKEFKDITVKDITTEAMINRATFYYHFEDIYDLLDKVLSEVLLINLNAIDFGNSVLNEASLIKIFVAITDFQSALSNRCHRGYDETIARIIREQLEIIFYKMLRKQLTMAADESLKITAVLLSWGLYGASVEWRRKGKELSPEAFIRPAIPFLMSGIDQG